MAAHLVNTGTVVEGMRVAAVVHEARDVAGGVRGLQELRLHVHLVELHREDRSAAASRASVRGQGSGVSAKISADGQLLTIRYFSWWLTCTVFMA